MIRILGMPLSLDGESIEVAMLRRKGGLFISTSFVDAEAHALPGPLAPNADGPGLPGVLKIEQKVSTT